MQQNHGIHDGHRERIRARFLKYGLDDFEPYAALEMLLYYAHTRGDTNELAHLLLERFGSICAVFDAPYEALLEVKGIGPPTATFLKSIPQFCRLYYDEKMNGRADEKRTIFNFEEARKVFQHKYIGRNTEVVILMLLDSQSRMVYCEILEKGSVNAVPVYVRKVVALALQYNAVSAILSHNHPSGNPLPSTGDLDSTEEVFHALEAVHVTLLDHIIIADENCISLASINMPAGLFEPFE